MWRELASVEQEAVALTLLGMQTDAKSGGSAGDAEQRPRQKPDVTQLVTPVEADRAQVVPTPAEADATQVVMAAEPGATELIPKSIDDLRGLTGSEIDEGGGPRESGVLTDGSYWSRWRLRWRRSALSSALAVTILFALTGEVSSYGPMEWAVAIFATLIGGGLLVGTLVNFVVAAI